MFEYGTQYFLLATFERLIEQSNLQVKKVRAKLRDLRIQLFRLAYRLGYQDHNLVKTIKYRQDTVPKQTNMNFPLLHASFSAQVLYSVHLSY